MGAWSARVNEGDTLCTVISKQQGNPLGHITLSQDEVAEIAVGDKVNIELNKYPTHSYGVLPGRIASVSFVPYNKKLCRGSGLSGRTGDNQQKGNKI